MPSKQDVGNTIASDKTKIMTEPSEINKIVLL